MSHFGVYEELLKEHLGSTQSVVSINHVSGGCINTTLKIETRTSAYFIKENSISQYELLEKEKQGLLLLEETSPLPVPEVLGIGKTSSKVYLLLEWIEKSTSIHPFWENFGRGLAHQHSVHAEEFGLDYDNHIGRLDQSNAWTAKWSDFFINERLSPQLELATSSHLIDQTIRKQFYTLFNKLNDLVPIEPPSLLHGDLWSGNFIAGPNQQAFLIDPSVHFGHRETELAFTTMFGGFDQQFYDSYNESFPLEKGFQDRIEIHNLYPLLVHVNLFGTSYLSGVKSTLNRFT